MIRTRLRRLPAACYQGHTYAAFTLCTGGRVRSFTRSDLADLAMRILEEACEFTGCETLAVCIMPDHVHLLLRGMRPDADLRRCVQRFKARMTIHGRTIDPSFRWQRGHYDHIVRGDKDLEAQIEYIRNNPVRARLVDNPDDYPFVFVNEP